MKAVLEPTSSHAAAAEQFARRANDLIGYIRSGRIIDAMHEFYADDVRMQENNNPPTVGLAANLVREEQFVAGVKRWLAFDVQTVAVDAERGRVAIQSTSAFEGVDGKTYRVDQVAVQAWRDGKIVEEKFYYDTGAAAA